MELRSAIASGDTAGLLQLIQTRRALPQQPSTRGSSALHVAAECDQPACIDLLLEHSICSVDARDDFEQTPLHWAATEARVAAVERLLHHGAHVNARDARGDTPLHAAAARGDLRTVKALVKAGADVNVQSGFGYTPLHAAARAKSVSVIPFLVGVGADLQLRDLNRQTARDVAVDEDPSLAALFDRAAAQQRLDAQREQETMSSLRTQLEELTKALSERDARVTQLQRTVDQSESTIRELQQRIHEDERSLQEAMMSAAAARAAADQQKEQEQRLAAAEQQVTELTQKWAASRAELDTARFHAQDDAARAEKIRNELQLRLDKAEEDKQFFTKEWKSRYGELEARLLAMTHEKETHEAHASRLQAELIEHQQQHDMLKHVLANAMTEISQLETERSVLHEKVMTMAASGGANAKTAAAAPDAELTRTRRELELVKLQLTTFRNDLADSQAAHNASKKQAADAKDELARVKEELRQVNARLSAAAATATAPTTAAQTSTPATTVVTGEHNAAQQLHIAELEGQRDAIRSALAQLSTLLLVGTNAVTEAGRRVKALHETIPAGQSSPTATAPTVTGVSAAPAASSQQNTPLSAAPPPEK